VRQPAPGACPDPETSELAAPYCFGDATEDEARRLEQHLLECEVCWAEVQRLETAVRVLRSDRRLARTLAVGEVAGLLGMSAGLDRPFAGHRRFALAAAALAASLFAVPVLVEVAYEWERYRVLALVLTPAAFVSMFAAVLGALSLDVRLVRNGRGGLGAALAALFAATALLWLSTWPLFGGERVVQASFQTFPLHLGYLKAMVHAWMVVPVFLLWPAHAVLVLQRELPRGRHAQVAALLTGDRAALPPRGLRYPRVWALAVYLVAVFAFHWVGASHLFDNLAPGPHAALFMGLVMLRTGLLLALPVACLWWYAGCLDELRREALAVVSFDDAPGEPRRG
jgi:hypothetical protein